MCLVVFSMLSLGRILISDLVVTNLLMCSPPGMILLYLATPFLHQRYFWMRYIHTDLACMPQAHNTIPQTRVLLIEPQRGVYGF